MEPAEHTEAAADLARADTFDDAAESTAIELDSGPARHRITGSKIKLARQCLYWARPDVELPPEQTSVAADIGTALHKIAEAGLDDDDVEEVVGGAFVGAVRALSRGQQLALDSVPDAYREQLSALADAWEEWRASFFTDDPLDGEKHTALVGLVELSMAVDIDTGDARVLGHARDYAKATSREVPFTLDAVGLTSEGNYVVIDYKTGQGPHSTAKHLDQLTIAAHALLFTDRFAKRASVGAVWVRPEGVAPVELVEVSPFDRAVLLRELRRMVDAVPGASPVPGLHCKAYYCPARRTCPATISILTDAKIDVGTKKRLPLVGKVDSDDKAIAFLVAEPLIQAWLDDRRDAVRAYSDQVGGFVGPDGLRYKGREVTRETPKIDATGAEAALVSVLGPEALDAIEVKRSTSFSAIRKVASKKKNRGEKVVIKDLEEQAREALRGASALKVSTFTQYAWKKD